MKLWSEMNKIYQKSEPKADCFHEWLDSLSKSEFMEYLDDAMDEVLEEEHRRALEAWESINDAKQP